MRARGPLFKTTAIFWSDYDPRVAGQEIVDLAEAATDGDAFCSFEETVRVDKPEDDPHPPAPEFFFDDDGADDDDDEDEDGDDGDDDEEED